MLFEAITDIAGRTRHFDIPFRFNVTPSFSDMGAYENQSTTPQKLYVNIGLSTGLNNGSTWADAFTGPAALQSALNIATEGNEIWVAAGTYKPSLYPPGCTNCTNNRDFSFHLKNGVKMYGGFAGNETNINLRYIDIYQTILSGDINSIGFITDNVSHVVTSVNDNSITTLDGFTIRDGGDFTTPDEPQIIVETFGIPKTTGGGLYSVSSEMNLKNMRFETNNSKSAGGMFFSQSTLGNFEDCYFANNEAVNDGGGIRFLSSSNISMNKLVFKGNLANNGGAILNQTTDFNAVNCIFYDNKSKFFGDASVLFNSQSSPSFFNCSIIANPTIGPAASDIVNTTSSTLSLTNTILWGNTSGGPLALVNSSGSTAIVTNSILKGGHSPCTSCPGSNGNIDPKIANSSDSDGIDNKFGTFDDGLALTTNSPALNAGTLAGAPIYDFNGSAVQQNVKDLGAYEFFPLNECQQNRLIADKPLATGNYKAGFVILSNANVANSSIVNLETSKNIMLLPGFTAENGAVFTAKIGENCLMGLE